MVPVLEGERVRLRGFTWADFSAFSVMWQEPEVAEFIPFAPVPVTQSWSRFNGNIYRWVSGGFGNWAVVDKEDRFLGTLGFFNNSNAGNGEDYDTAIQSGWVFASHSHGHGYASEAAKLAHEWLDLQPFGGRSVCGMNSDHIGSIRVAEKTGYQLMRRSEDAWGKVQLMERVRR